MRCPGKGSPAQELIIRWPTRVCVGGLSCRSHAQLQQVVGDGILLAMHAVENVGSHISTLSHRTVENACIKDMLL